MNFTINNNEWLILDSKKDDDDHRWSYFYYYFKVIIPICSSFFLWKRRDLLERFYLELDKSCVSVLCPSWSKREHLLNWTRKRIIPGWISCPLDFSLTLDDIWKDGSLLCTLINTSINGACLNPHKHKGRNIAHAQALVYKYLGILPPFTTEHFEKPLLDRRLEYELYKYLNEIKGKMENQEIDFRSKYTGCYLARGMGLTTGEKLNKCVFYLYPNSTEDSLLIAIKGPYRTYGNVNVSPFNNKKKQKTTYYYSSSHRSKFVKVVEEVMKLSLAGKTNAQNRSFSFQTVIIECLKKYKNEDERKEKVIPIMIDKEKDRIKVTYVPQNCGIHFVSIISDGCHLRGSPFDVIVVEKIEKFREQNAVIDKMEKNRNFDRKIDEVKDEEKTDIKSSEKNTSECADDDNRNFPDVATKTIIKECDVFVKKDEENDLRTFPTENFKGIDFWENRSRFISSSNGAAALPLEKWHDVRTIIKNYDDSASGKKNDERNNRKMEVNEFGRENCLVKKRKEFFDLAKNVNEFRFENRKNFEKIDKINKENYLNNCNVIFNNLSQKINNSNSNFKVSEMIGKFSSDINKVEKVKNWENRQNTEIKRNNSRRSLDILLKRVDSLVDEEKFNIKLVENENFVKSNPNRRKRAFFEEILRGGEIQTKNDQEFDGDGNKWENYGKRNKMFSKLSTSATAVAVYETVKTAKIIRNCKENQKKGDENNSIQQFPAQISPKDRKEYNNYENVYSYTFAKRTENNVKYSYSDFSKFDLKGDEMIVDTFPDICGFLEENKQRGSSGDFSHFSEAKSPIYFEEETNGKLKRFEVEKNSNDETAAADIEKSTGAVIRDGKTQSFPSSISRESPEDRSNCQINQRDFSPRIIRDQNDHFPSVKILRSKFEKTENYEYFCMGNENTKFSVTEKTSTRNIKEVKKLSISLSSLKSSSLFLEEKQPLTLEYNVEQPSKRVGVELQPNTRKGDDDDDDDGECEDIKNRFEKARNFFKYLENAERITLKKSNSFGGIDVKKEKTKRQLSADSSPLIKVTEKFKVEAGVYKDVLGHKIGMFKGAANRRRVADALASVPVRHLCRNLHKGDENDDDPPSLEMFRKSARKKTGTSYKTIFDVNY